MKTIRLTQGYATIVDNDVFERFSRQKWCACKRKNKRNVYAVGTLKINGQTKTVMLHRAILGFPASSIDHANGNSLDNRRSNLRLATDAQNKWNMKKPSTKSTSKYKGVRFHKVNKRWTAQISLNNRSKYIGIYDSEEEAAQAYNAVAKSMYGKYARLNRIS